MPKKDFAYKQTLQNLRKTAGEAETFSFDEIKQFLFKLYYLHDLRKEGVILEEK